MRIKGHRTSIALEELFWNGLEKVCAEKNVSIPKLIAMIDDTRDPNASLASAVRVYLYNHAINVKPLQRG